MVVHARVAACKSGLLCSNFGETLRMRKFQDNTPFCAVPARAPNKSPEPRQVRQGEHRELRPRPQQEASPLREDVVGKSWKAWIFLPEANPQHVSLVLGTWLVTLVTLVTLATLVLSDRSAFSAPGSCLLQLFAW